MKKGIFITILTFTLVGCSSTPQIKSTQITLPSLNDIHDVYLGDPIIKKALGSHRASITVGTADDISTAIYGGKFYYNGQYYVSDNPKSIGLKNGFGNIREYSNVATYDLENNEFCPANYWMPCYDSNEISVIYNPNDFRLAPASFSQEIEYNGKQGNILNLTYREFTNNSARTAYTTDFKIDLDESDTFGYKGAQFKVIKATNNKLTYQILTDFR